jgi:hypothetical protein
MKGIGMISAVKHFIPKKRYECVVQFLLNFDITTVVYSSIAMSKSELI